MVKPFEAYANPETDSMRPIFANGWRSRLLELDVWSARKPNGNSQLQRKTMKSREGLLNSKHGSGAESGQAGVNL